MQTSRKALFDGTEKALCEKSFYYFFKIGWRFINPEKFVDDWHLKTICDHLQEVYEGKTTRLIINIPPRCGKSLISTVFFPVWCWVKNPSMKFLTGSYSREFASRDTVKSRYLIQSPWFQKLWGDRFKFSTDQNQKTYYINTKQGERYSYSVNGALTGSGADIILVDDPINASNSNSKVIRDSTNAWFSEALSTRLNSQEKGAIILIMQRLHQNDLTGYLLDKERGNWLHLSLPMRFEGERKKYDKRRRERQILSKRFPNHALIKLEDSLGPYGTASQLQQRPVPRDGGFIKLETLRFYTELPHSKMYSWSWDTAMKTEEQNDFTVGTYWAECEDGFYLIDMWRKKVKYPQLVKQIEILSDSSPASEILVEDKSSGQQVIQDLRQSTNLPIIGMNPGKDMLKSKQARVEFVSPLFEAGKVKFPKHKKWMNDLIDELINFPNATHDDIVDSISQYLSRKINKRKLRFDVL